jgi:nitroreductase
MGKDSAYPVVLPENAENCIFCGHCEAVCPGFAVKVAAPQLQEAASFVEKAKISAEQIGSYMRLRRSIRVYEQKAVPKKILEGILDIARYAPTAMNAQPVRWIVVHDSAKLKKIVKSVIDWMRSAIENKAPVADALDFGWLVKDYENGNDPICRNAPHLVVTYAHKDNPMAVGDSTIALATFELAALAFGVGTCWAGFFRIAAAASAEVKKELGIPDGHVCTGAMMAGYPKYQYKRIPKRNKIAVNWL